MPRSIELVAGDSLNHLTVGTKEIQAKKVISFIFLARKKSNFLLFTAKKVKKTRVLSLPKIYCPSKLRTSAINLMAGPN